MRKARPGEHILPLFPELPAAPPQLREWEIQVLADLDRFRMRRVDDRRRRICRRLARLGLVKTSVVHAQCYPADGALFAMLQPPAVALLRARGLRLDRAGE